jgi:hypothetical protein
MVQLHYCLPPLLDRHLEAVAFIRDVEMIGQIKQKTEAEKKCKKKRNQSLIYHLYLFPFCVNLQLATGF